MPISIRGQSIDAAVRNPEDMRRLLVGMAHKLALYDGRLGIFDGFQDDPTNAPQAKAAPPPASFNVAGVDGKFEIQITLPQDVQPPTVTLYQASLGTDMNRLRAPILHQIQSATSVLFDAASKVTTYGPTPETSLSITNPNVTLFWRLRSSYDGVNWNGWQVFISATVCGPIGVSSGLMRSASISIANTATTPSGASPLTQQGTTTQINVAASLWKAGNQTINYNSGSVNPGSYGKFYVYADDPGRAGGSVIFVATNNVADITAADARVYFGVITTAAGGGGTGSGGGGGSCCIGSVMVEMADGSQRRQDLLRAGENVAGPDGPDEIVSIELVADQPCFQLELDNGVIHQGCSAGHSLKRHAAGWETAFEIQVGDILETRKGPGTVQKKSFIGNHTVYKMVLARNRVFVGDGLTNHNATYLNIK
ncbi:MAG TPA: hypothetical protein VG759_27025 [Candidatus Angelobacter sp.]|jgi:hypothetical protein|nr:hypothetical protein [Candidatus Angelobacter sp.]